MVDDELGCFNVMHQCNRQTDRQTPHDSVYRAMHTRRAVIKYNIRIIIHNLRIAYIDDVFSSLPVNGEDTNDEDQERHTRSDDDYHQDNRLCNTIIIRFRIVF